MNIDWEGSCGAGSYHFSLHCLTKRVSLKQAAPLTLPHLLWWGDVNAQHIIQLQAAAASALYQCSGEINSSVVGTLLQITSNDSLRPHTPTSMWLWEDFGGVWTGHCHKDLLEHLDHILGQLALGLDHLQQHKPSLNKGNVRQMGSSMGNSKR